MHIYIYIYIYIYICFEGLEETEVCLGFLYIYFDIYIYTRLTQKHTDCFATLKC